MLSYQHSYHAGNFADVLKHVTLTRLMHYLMRKDKPLLYLETHAGRGLYDLKSKYALKTGEAKQGIGLLWNKKDHLSAVFSPYIQALNTLNSGGQLVQYPGSPWLAIHTLRSQDRIVCTEWHPQEFASLQQLSHSGKRVFIRQINGLDEMKALLPPLERRGLIFIDPAYEVKAEYRQVPQAIHEAYQRFATGVYCLWYPLLDAPYHAQLLQGLKKIGASDNLGIEFNLGDPLKQGIKGCGLWIINPPYVLAAELKIVLEALTHLFNPGQSSQRVFSL